jgi:probable HAF family extracellular repeat protein
LSTNARPVVFKNDSIRDLGTLGGNSGAASAINSSGAIAGHSATSDGQTHAFLFRNDEIVDIGEWQTTSQANGMNNKNQVVGFRRVNQYNSFPEAFLYEEGVVRGLGTIEGGYSSSAFSINESGYVTGHSTVMRGSPASHAFIFDGTLMKDLGTLGGANSVGYSINDFNIIVGKSNVSMTNNTERAFMYEDGRMIDLGALDRTDSVAFAVNNRGWVVGTALNQSGPTTLNRGFIYSKSSGMVDLNSLLPAGTPWIIIEARSINSLGQIVGTGVIEGRTRAFLMSPSRM